jgi:archaetidylinositol phosphate synthase
MLALASVCVFLNGFLDAVDGHVARITKRHSKRGDLFDHAIDRYSDIFIIGGIMLSPYCNTVLGALALIAVLMTSYMGTQAQALGCGRNYSGLLGRADRLVILIFVPLVQMGVNYYIPTGKLPLPGLLELTILEFTMIWFIVAGNITAVHRGILSWRELRDQEKPQKKLEHFYTPSEPQRMTRTQEEEEFEVDIHTTAPGPRTCITYQALKELNH